MFLNIHIPDLLCLWFFCTAIPGLYSLYLALNALLREIFALGHSHVISKTDTFNSIQTNTIRQKTSVLISNNDQFLCPQVTGKMC